MSIFVNELIGACVQVVLFALVPFIWWLITARKKNFFEWIGLKKIKHEGSVRNTVLIVLGAVAVYGGLTVLSLGLLPEGVTTAGSDFAGMGAVAIPAVLAYGFIRTGFAEELLFRGTAAIRALICFCEKLVSENAGLIQDVSQTYKEEEACFEFEFKTHATVKSEKWQSLLTSNEGIKSISNSAMDIA